MKKVVLINGVARVGKDTIVTFIEQSLMPFNIRVYNFTSTHEVKEQLQNPSEEIIKRLQLPHPWDGITKDDFWRRAMVELKRIHTYEMGDRPTQYLIESINSIGDGVIFLHVREPHNIAKLKEHFREMQTLLITRSGVPIPDNDSDRSVYEWKEYDYIFENDGDTLDELRESIEPLSVWIRTEVKDVESHVEFDILKCQKHDPALTPPTEISLK